MEAPKLELLVYLPGGVTERVLIPHTVAPHLCPAGDDPACPAFPLRMALSVTRGNGVGTSVVYERQVPEAARVDDVPGVQRRKGVRRDRAARAAGAVD